LVTQNKKDNLSQLFDLSHLGYKEIDDLVDSF